MNRQASDNDGSDYRRIAVTEFPDDPRLIDLVTEFLTHRRGYRHAFVEALFHLATGSWDGRPDQLTPAPSWELRRLAALMLQQQFLCLPDDRVDLSLAFLGKLGLLSTEQPAIRLRESVLKEGYTTTVPDGFLREFRRRLRRLNRVVAPIRRTRITPRLFRDFLAISRHECNLALARYLFGADEVAQRIFAQVRIASGEPVYPERPVASAEAKMRLGNLPDFERAIMRSIGAKFNTYWMAERTSARINSLVEQPVGTVVLTIKPPGSSLEIEIKRVGRPTPRPVGVVFERGGRPVPPPHRLDGASVPRRQTRVDLPQGP
jgi:hypothetical protein